MIAGAECSQLFCSCLMSDGLRVRLLFLWRSVNVIVGHEVLKLLSSHILKQLVAVIMMSCGLGSANLLLVGLG